MVGEEGGVVNINTRPGFYQSRNDDNDVIIPDFQ